MKIFPLLSALLIISCISCSNDNVSTATEVKIDSTEVLQRLKQEDEIFSPYDFDSICKAVQASGIETFPAEWVKLIQNGSDWVVLQPMNGDNHRITIVNQNGAYVLREGELQSVTEHLITGFREEKNRYVITYLYGIGWTGSNHLDYLPTEKMYTYTDFVFKKVADPKYRLLSCDFPEANSIYTDAATAKALEVIKPEEEQPLIDYDNIEIVPAE